eukprot:scaffold878_cov271-Pinguiococcus_pyrenoidosus.AAC.1
MKSSMLRSARPDAVKSQYSSVLWPKGVFTLASAPITSSRRARSVSSVLTSSDSSREKRGFRRDLNVELFCLLKNLGRQRSCDCCCVSGSRPGSTADSLPALALLDGPSRKTGLGPRLPLAIGASCQRRRRLSGNLGRILDR